MSLSATSGHVNSMAGRLHSASTGGYHTTPVDRMNRQYFSPAIRREIVWKLDQILQFFDSILRGYPISSFLFWELKPENRDKW